MVKKIVTPICVIALCFAFSQANAQPGRPAPLSNLKDLDKIEMATIGTHVDQDEVKNGKPLPSVYEDKDTAALKRELELLRKSLAKAPVEMRPAVLEKLAAQTKWGTPERFIAYYVCAWYGVTYTKTRTYLVHAAYWWEWKIGSEDNAPFSFGGDCSDSLYALYEHNLDFQLLHDIITTQSDAHLAETIAVITDEAVVNHPRGVLHTAALSPKGGTLVYNIIHADPDGEDYPLGIIDDGPHQRSYRAYVKKVANDPGDPLSALARDLLKEKPKSRR